MAKNVTYFDMAENDYMFLYDDFQCNWRKIINVDGYYFSARYPGEESFMVDKEDVEDCWEAVEETRSAVLRYIEDNEICVEDITKDSEVIKALKKFDE